MLHLNQIGSFLSNPFVAIVLAPAFLAALRYLDPQSWRFMLMTCTITLAVAGFTFLISRRAVFSLYTAGSTTLLIGLASLAKFSFKGFALHIYDFVFFGSDWSAIKFLLDSFLLPFVVGFFLLLAAVLLLTAVYRAENPIPAGLLIRLPVFVGLATIAIVLFPAKRPGEPDYLVFINGYNASSFYYSLGQIGRAFQSGLMEASAAVNTARPPFKDTVTCPAGGSPDVVIVLAESLTYPGYFPQINADETLLQTFRSEDGSVHPLYVETFGGGTWVTNFSLMTGLSSAEFGWRSSYVTLFLEGRIKGALPDLMRRCGYRTLAMAPLEYEFVNEGPFLTSIGVDNFLDPDDTGIPAGAGTRDQAYFDKAVSIIRELRAKSDRPIFLQIQTMFPHGPYDHAEEITDELADHPYAEDPQVNEYMRRLAANRRDFNEFLDRIADEPGERGTVVLEFGDHQSAATKTLAAATEGTQSVLGDYRSIAYRTFAAIHGFETEVDTTPLHKTQDIAFLGASLLDAAKLPRSPVFEDLSRLRELCDGAFHSCKERQLIEEHLARRRDGGMLLSQ